MLSISRSGHSCGVSSNLQPPIRPARRDYDEDDDPVYHRGSLSDFSDYESSDEGTHNRASASTSTVKHQYPHARQQGSRSSDDEVESSVGLLLLIFISANG